MSIPKPSLGRVVIYRSRTGDYSVPATINCTVDSIFQPGVDAGHVPPLTEEKHVHLTVMTPGKPGMRRDAANFKNEGAQPRSENVAGCYQEWDIPFWQPMGIEAVKWDQLDYDVQPPGTWTWPARV